MNIDQYDFGKITISGKIYSSDAIIYNDKVNSPWRRKEGHNLCLEDLVEVLEAKPDILIIGTGAYGIMSVASEVKEALEAKRISLVIARTAEACKEFNRLKDSGNVIAALHLTC